MRLLLHICCAPCAVYPLESFLGEGIEVMGTFHNPNIHPFQEYERRRKGVETLLAHVGVQLLGKDSYGLRDFLREMVFREESRCRPCIHMRLRETARRAKAGGFEAFSSTMLSSQHMDHVAVREIGENLAREAGLSFLYRDFRPGWRRSLEVCRALDIYRQNYCGCIYSEEERFGGWVKSHEEAKP